MSPAKLKPVETSIGRKQHGTADHQLCPLKEEFNEHLREPKCLSNPQIIAKDVAAATSHRYTNGGAKK